MDCPNCGKLNPKGQRFCDGCGTRLARVCQACKTPAAAEARFCGHCGAPLAVDPATAAATSATADVPDAQNAPLAGERRHLTVMFADLVGSTALSGRLDPETLRDVLRAFQDICAEAITRYGGTISQYLGDGVLAYFGYPTAHDNDAERAILAGLLIVAGVQKLVASEARVGIHSGLVVVGAVGAGEGSSHLAIGETPNLAARVQGEAVPNSVCISDATLELVGDRFEVMSLGMRALKGVSKSIALHAVSAAIEPDRDRLAARFGMPIVGRGAELRHLLERHALARQGHGQAVFLSGQGGIGKSRLLGEFRVRSALPAAQWRSMHCSPFDQNSALRPMIDLLERVIRSTARGLAHEPARALGQVLDGAGVADPAAHALIGALMGIGRGAPGPADDLAPAQRKLRTLDAVIAWLQADAQRSPLVLVVEDLHWVDASTRDLLGSLLERIAGLPILLIATFRSEFVPPWPVNERISSIVLSRLGPEEVLSIAQGIAGQPLSPQLVDEIVRRTDGVPLFVEELSKAILGSPAVVQQDGVLQLASAGAGLLAVPATLLDLLTAQLDRLGPAKAVAQLASVLGREFDYLLLHAVSDVSETELDLQLAALNRANIIRQSGVPPRSHYVFKHALIQEAAYETLLKSARQRHHRRAAEAYVTRSPDVVQSRPELVAHHYSLAALHEASVPLWQQAGELAVARSGYEEALTHFNAGLAQIALAPKSDALAKAELVLRVKLGPALMARLGMGSPPTAANYTRACELAQSVGEPADQFAALWGDWLNKNTRGQLVAASERSEDLVALGRRLPEDDGFELQAHHSRWTNFLFMGDMTTARIDTQDGVGIYDRYRHRHHKNLFGGHDPGVCARNFGAVAAWATGHADEARALVAEALALAQGMNHSFTLAAAYMFASITLLSLGDPAAAAPIAERHVLLCKEHGFAQWLGVAQIASGISSVSAGNTEAGIRLLEEGLASHLARGPVGFSLPLLAMAAQVHLDVGAPQRALELLSTAIELSDRSGMAWNRSESLRLKATTLLALGQIGIDEAIASVEEARRLAGLQGALALERRAVNTLASLHLRRNDVAAARTALESICTDPRGTGASIELAQAKALLAGLVDSR